jgi:hypothetical protein
MTRLAGCAATLAVLLTVAAAPARGEDRPRFPLPDLDDPLEMRSELLADSLLVRGLQGEDPGAPAPGALSWTRRIPPAVPGPGERPGAALEAWAALGTGPGLAAGGRAGPRPDLELRGDGEVRNGHLAGRDHRHLRAEATVRSRAPRPAWLVGASLRVSGETWGTDAAARPGDMRFASLSARWRRRLAIAGEDLVLGADAGAADARTRACGLGGCAAGEEQRRGGGWRSVGVGCETASSLADLRRYAGSDADRTRRLDAGLWAGLARRRGPDRAGSSVARWRGRLAWTVPRGRWHLHAGLSGAGEGGRSWLGPRAGARRFWWQRGMGLAFEIAPEIRFAEEALASPGRVPEAALIRPAAAGELWPRAPVVLDPALPPQCAAPCATAEFFRQGRRGALGVGCALARLREPVDWIPESLGAGGAVVRMRSATASSPRWMVRLTVRLDETLPGGAQLRLTYDATRDPWASDPGRALHFLPEQRLGARLSGRAGRWFWEAQLDGRGRTPRASGSAGLDPSLELGASVGYEFGRHRLQLVGVNLGDAASIDDPYGVRTRRWVGLRWNCAAPAYVP